MIELYWELYSDKIEKRIKNSDNDEKIKISNDLYIEKYGNLSMDTIKTNLTKLSYGETPFTSLYTGKLSHDDLLQFAYLLCKKYPVILRKIRDKYDYIFIDEYQDTSAFVLKIFYSAVKEKNDVKLYLLGDRMQQIYHNYDGSFETEFKEFDSSIKLDINHRSVEAVISILNNIYNDKDFDQNTFENNKNIVPDIYPQMIVTQDVNSTIAGIQEKYPSILTLYLMNREKYEEIGASNLYQCYSDMEMYSFGRKYTVSDVLSDTTDDNPDPLMRFLFYITKIMNFYNNESYGMVISLCKNKKQYFNANTFTLHNHIEKAFLKQKLEQVKSVFDNDASSVKNLLDSLQEVDVVKVDMIDDIIQKTEYSHVLDVQFKEVKKLMEYLNSPTISTQHGVKGESHTSVLFVADDSNNNPNVRMYDFFKMWSTFDFSLPEFEKMYYSYIMDIVDIETKLGTKMSNLTKETHNENELNKQNIKACCENAIKKYENNKIFEFLCKKDFLDYLNNPTVTNAKKIFKISKMEGILTAYKLFYVGCSRARKNLIIVVNGAKISKFQHDFIQKAKAIGFSVNTTLDF